MGTNIIMSEGQLSNVTHVLFGNQKQASVINKAVVKIIARNMVDEAGEACLNSEEAFITATKDYLQSLCDEDFIFDEDFILLLCGESSLACLKAEGPKVVHVNQSNPESPKHTFRVGIMGEEPEVDNSAEDNYMTITVSKPAHTSTDCPYEPTDDFPTRARKIKDAILPLCPLAVKTEIPNDEYAQALCMAEYYYKNIYTGKPEPKVPNGETAEKIYKMFLDGAALGDIAKQCNISLPEVKSVLNNRGFNVA